MDAFLFLLVERRKVHASLGTQTSDTLILVLFPCWCDLSTEANLPWQVSEGLQLSHRHRVLVDNRYCSAPVYKFVELSFRNRSAFMSTSPCTCQGDPHRA